MSQIREEFDKAFNEFWDDTTLIHSGQNAALWAANWTAERIAKEASGETARNILEIAKELEP